MSKRPTRAGRPSSGGGRPGQRRTAQDVVAAEQDPRVEPVGQPAGADRADDVEDADQGEQAGSGRRAQAAGGARRGGGAPASPAGGGRAPTTRTRRPGASRPAAVVVPMPWSWAAGMKWVPMIPLVLAPQMAK